MSIDDNDSTPTLPKNLAELEAQRKILAFFAKEENKILLLDNQKRKTEDIKKCRSQRDAVGKSQISCQFTQPGVYQVFLYSIGQTREDINDIGQLKFHAL